jgi:hypothetical protein
MFADIYRPAGRDTSTVGEGLVIGLALQSIQILIFPLLVKWIFLGVSQLIYIGPAIWMASRRGQYNRRKGLIIAASLVALINAACWGGFLLSVGNVRIGG